MSEELPVYEPDEDSYLLLDVLNDELLSWEARGKSMYDITLLDMGMGSGILGFAAAKRGISTTLVDINPAAIEQVKQELEKEEFSATVIQSDLFEALLDKAFDIIVFNTPYLPNDEELQDPALHGGKEGNEVAIRFINDLSSHLHKAGVVLLLTSSLAHVSTIEKTLKESGFRFEVAASKKLFFEELLVYKIQND